LRFKIDQNLPAECSALLRQAGFEAETVDDEGLGGADDLVISERARTDGVALMTLDLDFSDIRSYPPQQYSGIIVIRSRAQDKITLVSMLRRLILVLRERSPERQLWIVQPDRIRFRDS
jgi:predicted nuclease of predicted toxin-antitoxin system